jgi:hypothetical protein
MSSICIDDQTQRTIAELAQHLNATITIGDCHGPAVVCIASTSARRTRPVLGEGGSPARATRRRAVSPGLSHQRCCRLSLSSFRPPDSVVVSGPHHREVALPLSVSVSKADRAAVGLTAVKIGSTSRFIASGPRWEVSRKVLRTRWIVGIAFGKPAGTTSHDLRMAIVANLPTCSINALRTAAPAFPPPRSALRASRGSVQVWR